MPDKGTPPLSIALKTCRRNISSPETGPVTEGTEMLCQQPLNLAKMKHRFLEHAHKNQKNGKITSKSKASMHKVVKIIIHQLVLLSIYTRASLPKMYVIAYQRSIDAKIYKFLHETRLTKLESCQQPCLMLLLVILLSQTPNDLAPSPSLSPQQHSKSFKAR